jgi:hypothetical protein
MIGSPTRRQAESVRTASLGLPPALALRLSPEKALRSIPETLRANQVNNETLNFEIYT